jgi:hypothetical protein
MIVPLLIAAAAIAQQPPITEKIEVSVVNVDVTVTGADGQPVWGLSADDFEIFDDGRRQAITNFYVVEDSGPPLSGQKKAAVLHCQIVAAVRDETTENVGAAEINVTPH